MHFFGIIVVLIPLRCCNVVSVIFVFPKNIAASLLFSICRCSVSLLRLRFEIENFDSTSYRLVLKPEAFGCACVCILVLYGIELGG
jgi:hypothetical protein